MTGSAGASRAVILALALALALTAGAAASSDLSPWPVIILAAAAWTATLTRTCDLVSAVALTVVGVLAALGVVLLAGPLIPVSFSYWLPALAGLTGWVACALLLRGGTRGAAVERPAGLWFAALVGPAIWLIAQTATLALSVPDRLSWAMRNDISNTLIMAHDIIRHNGISFEQAGNPAPLPAVLISLTAMGGRGAVDPADLLEHDLGAIALLWGGLVMLTSALAGLTSATVARTLGARPLTVLVAALFGSLLVLSWLFTGYALEYGFLNTHVILPILFSSVLVFLGCRSRALLGSVGLLLASAAAVVSWSPITIVPLGLLVIHVVVNIRGLLAVRGINVVGLVAAILIPLGLAIAVAVPSLLTQREALAGVGGIYNPGKWVMFVIAGTLIVATFLVLRRKPSIVWLMSAGVLISSLLGLGVLLFVSRRAPDAWTYYPVKFSWLATLLMMTLLVGALVALASKWGQTAKRTAVFLAPIAAGITTLLIWTPFIATFLITMNPIDRLLRSHTIEKYPVVSEVVLDLADPAAPAILWRSNLVSLEGEINIWLIQAWVDSLTADKDLRLLSYLSYDDKDVGLLCDIGTKMGPGLNVYSMDPHLRDEVDSNCRDTGMRVHLGVLPQ